MQNKRALVFVESYVSGGSDKIAKLLVQSLDFGKIYLMVNKGAPSEMLLDNLDRSKVEVIKYSLISPAQLGEIALKYKNIKVIYNFLRIINLLVRYPLILISIIYFYILIRPLNINVFFSNNGGYPGGEYNRSSSIAASFLTQEHTYHIYHSLPKEYIKLLSPIEKLYDKYLQYKVQFITDSKYCGSLLNINRNITKKTIVIYNGIIPLKQKANYDCFNKNRLSLLQVGTLDSNKNQLLSIQAVNILVKKGCDVTLYLVGKEAEEGYIKLLEEYIKENKLEKNIFFEGFQSDVYKYYKSCDILLLTSKIESFPTVILESMSSGIPVVATNAGGIKEQIEDSKSGFVIKHDVNMLVDKIEFFYSNRKKIKVFADYANKIFNKKFTIDKMIQSYQRLIYEKL